MSDEDKSQKTEEPTQRRIEDAVKRGQQVSSREVNHMVMIGTMTLIMGMILPYSIQQVGERFTALIETPHAFAADTDHLRRLFTGIFLDSTLIMAVLIGGTLIAAILATMLQHPITVSLESIKPKLEKVSIIKGLGRMFSLRSVVELVKGITKVTIVGIIAYLSTRAYQPQLDQLPGYEPIELYHFFNETILHILISVTIAIAVIAIFDYLYQRFEYFKNLRMSRKELKDEYKDQEGDPHIKAKIRAIRVDRARKRMMASVPTADVIVTNPTHFAVALKYDRATMRAPKLVAKGADKVAFRIRELGKEHEVPIIENPPVARSLFKDVEIDQEIPVEHYQAVAEIISYIYKLKHKLK